MNDSTDNTNTQKIDSGAAKTNQNSSAKVSLDMLDGSLRGYVKVLQKLTRGIEKANYQSSLLQSAIKNNRPPPGLLPKVIPRIPDFPSDFVIEWEVTSMETGLSLTKLLQEYWVDRANRLGKECQPILKKLETLTNQEQFATIQQILSQTARDMQIELNRKKTRPKDDETPSRKKPRNRRFKRPKPGTVTPSQHQS